VRTIYTAGASGSTGPTQPTNATQVATYPQETVDLLARLYAYPEESRGSRPWVRANMISSVDGAAEAGGRSGGLGGPADRTLLQVLRSLADVILVGAGTARVEGYGPAQPLPMLGTLRAGRPASPAIAVMSASLNLDPESALLTDASKDSRTIVLTSRSAPADRRAAIAKHAELIVAESDQITARYAVTELARRGHSRILAEGGPSLLAQIAGQGLLDELCLTISPMLVSGDARRILSGRHDDMLSGISESLSLAHVLTEDGYLFCRYLHSGR
jgi:riboflavin biosynthesis pyrimidine reductase